MNLRCHFFQSSTELKCAYPIFVSWLHYLRHSLWSSERFLPWLHWGLECSALLPFISPCECPHSDFQIVAVRVCSSISWSPVGAEGFIWITVFARLLLYTNGENCKRRKSDPTRLTSYFSSPWNIGYGKHYHVSIPVASIKIRGSSLAQSLGNYRTRV